MDCISVSSLYKSYNDINAINGINLSVKYGEILGFLGPNGAGKSTLIKILTTLIKPSRGIVKIFGIDIIKNPLKIRNKIGVVFQKPSYEPFLTVEKSLDKYGMMWNICSNERKNKMKHIVSDFELEHILKRKNEDLSIGQRRRVQIAREFMHDMDLLFLDEPTAGLDPASRRNLLGYLKNKTKQGLTIFLTTHILSEAEYICDRIAIMNKGKIITTSSPHDLKNKFNDRKKIQLRVPKLDQKTITNIMALGDCKIIYEKEHLIIINSKKSELILYKVLQILITNKIPISDLTFIQNTLEDIFLDIVNN